MKWNTLIVAALVSTSQAAQLLHDLPISGDNLGLWPCGAIPGRQTYIVEPTSGGDLASHIVVNPTSNLVFDISGPSNASGTLIHVWGSYTPIHPNQQWVLTPLQAPPAPPQAVSIVSLYDNMCIGAQFPGSIGSPIGIYACNSSDPTQMFLFSGSSTTSPPTPGVFTFATSAQSSEPLCIQAGNNTPSCDFSPFNTYPYCDSTLSITERLADLLSRMTLDEKANSLDSGVPELARLGIPSMHSGEALHGVAVGCLPSSPGNGSTGCPTSFPSPMAMGATFDDALWVKIGIAIGMEGRALYNTPGGGGSLWVFAPNINLQRDSRWGRAQEVPSEDSTLVSRYATSFITGLQGGPNGGVDPKHILVASTSKHFVAYDLEGFEPRIDPLPRPPTGTCDTPSGCQRWNFDASPIPRDFQNYYVAPFEAAIDAGVRSIMCAYSGIYGAAACGSTLINEQFRTGSNPWDGHVVSDCTAIELMGDMKFDNCAPPYPPANCHPDSFPGHNFTHGVIDTMNVSFGAGTDVNCGPFYRMWLPALLANGSIAVEAVDTAVARLYTSAIMLGLLDPSADAGPYAQIPASVVDSYDHRMLALQAAQESIILLKNVANTLPLNIQSGGPNNTPLKIAFLGPHANSTQAFLSNYHGENTLVNSHSPLMIAQQRGWQVTYEQGCNICDVVPPGFPNMPCPPGSAKNTSGVAAAAVAAASADVAVLFIGSDQTTEAENFDRTDITLAGVQEYLAMAVVIAQPRTIVVLVSGGTVSSVFVTEMAAAILQVHYPGELGGDAIIDVLEGVVNPSGKLPVTMYYPNITQRDIRDMDLAAEGGITHSFFTGPVLFPFGSGLSYTEFTYEAEWVEEGEEETGPSCVLRNAKANAKEMTLVSLSSATSTTRQGGNTSAQPQQPTVLLRVRVRVTNIGERAGDVVVLGFARPPPLTEEEKDMFYARPRQTLVDFSRLHNVAPGESRCEILDVPTTGSIGRSTFGLLSNNNNNMVKGHHQNEKNNSRSEKEEEGGWSVGKGVYELRIGDVENPAVLKLTVA